MFDEWEICSQMRRHLLPDSGVYVNVFGIIVRDVLYQAQFNARYFYEIW